MKTYAEATGHAPFDWAEFLNREPETITEDDWIAAAKQASKWPTCACGNLCEDIPRVADGPLRDIPTDAELAAHGYRFSYEIGNRDIHFARETFAQTEARSTEILKEMGKL